MSEVLGWVALLLHVAGGFYGVMQSYRQDLDRLPRILSRLLVLPAAVVISHVFPWAISIPALWCLSVVVWGLLLYLGRSYVPVGEHWSDSKPAVRAIPNANQDGRRSSLGLPQYRHERHPTICQRQRNHLLPVPAPVNVALDSGTPASRRA